MKTGLDVMHVCLGIGFVALCILGGTALLCYVMEKRIKNELAVGTP
jgi:predicted methyltransferase